MRQAGVDAVEALRGHDDAVFVCCASSAWSIVVTGSKDELPSCGIQPRHIRTHAAWTRVERAPGCHRRKDVPPGDGERTRGAAVVRQRRAASMLGTSANISEPVTSLAFFERDYHVGRLACFSRATVAG